MRRSLMRWVLATLVASACVAWMATPVIAEGPGQRHHYSVPEPVVDVVGDALQKAAAPARPAQGDTVWIGDWNFDGPGCTSTGWETVDLRDLSAITPMGIFWRIDPSYDGTGAISGNAAILGYVNNACCVDVAGYDNDWYQAIRIEYAGATATLSFDYVVDSEFDFDFVRVETDSACSSFDRVDLDAAPTTFASDLRDRLFEDSGFVETGGVSGLMLEDYGPGTHCAYIAFFSDIGFSPCDGASSTNIGSALLIDTISISDDSGVRSEDFTDGTLDIGTFVNIQDESPFGQWARLFLDITDNDVCTENTTCAWLWTDHTTPTIANDPSMSFAPGTFVVRNWLDNAIVSPWVSLATTPDAAGTVLQFRRFPGNFFSTSLIAANYSVRGRQTVDGSECISGWGHALQWNSLSVFTWIGITADISPDFDATAEEIQVRHRVSDWQWIAGEDPPPVFAPGPGPFVDRFRIGRIVISGPVLNEGIDARFQAQDCFPTEIHTGVTPGAGEHFRPSTGRFGTAAFSQGTELGINGTSPNLITGDSVLCEAKDVRDVGGIASLDWYGSIVSGPHVGKAPPPHTVGSNGFFVVAADTSRFSDGTPVEDLFFVDLDDDYFRGGDVVHYVWLAEDAAGGVSSLPGGLSAAPGSVEDAQLATGGMYEVSFLPAVEWDSNYLARIQADTHGKLEPTAQELTNSFQANCILYVNRINSRRLSGQVNRTSFMYTMDRIGYDGVYDVYDHTGMGNTNNHLGGRCAVTQAQGYSLIVYDAGAAGPGGTIMPDGSNLDSQKVDQAGWFRNWLGQASVSEAGTATLWVIGSDVLEEKPTHPLFTAEMKALLVTPAQGIEPNPDVVASSNFSFQQGEGTCDVTFVGDEYTLSGGCPFPRRYDGMAALGSPAVETHHYKSPKTGAVGEAAIIMNTNATARWNTVFQSHPWFDIRGLWPEAPAPPHPAQMMMTKILTCALAPGCGEAGDPTDTRTVPLPQRTVLHANVPNPFNPMTEIRFDLARDGRVVLQVFDVAGRLVRTLIDEQRTAGAGQRVLWDGMDESGQRAATGVYLYRLAAPDMQATRKMILVQ